MRDMSKFEQEYSARGVEFLCVNAFESEEKGRAWTETSGLDYRWAYADEATLEKLGVKAVPTQIVVGRGGKITWASSLGTLGDGAEAVRAALDEALRVAR